MEAYKINDLSKEILAYILDCEYLDVDYIIRQVDTLDLDIFAAIDIAEAGGKINFNNIIHYLQVQYVDLLEDKYRNIISLDEGVHYTTYQNCLDSHIYANEEQLRHDFRDEPEINVEELINEINKW